MSDRNSDSSDTHDRPLIGVTGATGFIGTNIVRYLLENGYDVLGMDFEVNETDPLVEAYLEDADGEVIWIDIDLRDEERSREIAENYDLNGIIHAAVYTAVTPEMEREDPHGILATNIMGTINVLELARLGDVDRFVYVSSSGVYGSTDDPNVPVTESEIGPYVGMENFYLTSKISSEQLVDRYATLFDMTTCSVRIAAPYGPMERPTSTRFLMGPIFRLLELVNDEGLETIRVNGLAYVRDWTFAMDTAQGIVSALDAPEPKIYNVAGGINYTLEEILNAAQRVPNLEFEWEVVDDPDDADLVANVGSLRGPLSILRAQNELGYEPQYDLERGIEAYQDWWVDAAADGLR